ncbi:MAG TPA: hypothetical protein VHM25_26555, partial [Polyangiaceae bacterium]|nr:hypothetical protein [Polyangiaceae bacterium]
SCGDGLVVASRDFCRSDGAFCTVLEDGTYCTGAAPRQCPPGQQVIGLGLCGPVGGAGGSDGSGAAGNASADGGSIGGEGGVAPGGAD